MPSEIEAAEQIDRSWNFSYLVIFIHLICRVFLKWLEKGSPNRYQKEEKIVSKKPTLAICTLSTYLFEIFQRTKIESKTNQSTFSPKVCMVIFVGSLYVLKSNKFLKLGNQSDFRK